MAELNFGALARPGPRGFAQGFEQGQEQRMTEDINRTNLETGRFKLDELKRDRAEMMQLQTQLKGMGQDPDLDKLMDVYVRSGRPDYVKMGIEGKQKLKEQRAFAQYQAEFYPPTSNATAPTGMPTGAPAFGMPAGAQPSGDYDSTQAMGRVPGVVSAPIPESPPMNALAPAPAAPATPVNALASQPNIASLEARYRRVANIDTLGAKAEAALLLKQIEAASKESRMYTVPGVGLVDSTGRVVKPSVATPTAPPAMVAEYTFAKTPEGGNFQGTYQQFVTARAAAGRAPVQPVAPTITQIQDPNNPLQMITIDARRYQGGGVGSPGVIGTTGKSAPAAAAAQKQEQGATQAQDILDNLKYAYEELDRQRAIPSTQRGAISNILTSIGTSGVGQVAGRVAGTEAQTQRDIIASARNQLFAAVKNATGLSAQNLNSNVEFTTWLNSLTDPAKSIEANREILANMEKFIGSGGKYTARKEDGKAAPSASGRPEGVGADWTLMTDKNNNRAWVSPDRKSFKEVK
jgi:hypothetical protein